MASDFVNKGAAGSRPDHAKVSCHNGRFLMLYGSLHAYVAVPVPVPVPIPLSIPIAQVP